MEKRTLVSVVLSFCNEEQVIPKLIKRLKNTFNPLKIDYELVFVNDASTDNSLNLLLDSAKTDSRIKIITMTRRFGASQCVLAGMKYSKGDAVVYMDTDLQDPPELIPELIKKWEDGADVVYTTRITRAGESAIKMWTTKWAYRALKSVSNDIDLPLNSGDFKLLDRRVVNELLKLQEKDPFLRGLVSWLGFKQVQVFYNREKRFAGKTHFPLWRSTGPVKEFIRGITSFSAVPLYFALVMGFVVSLGAFLYLIYIVITRFIMGMHLPGWSASMVTMLFLGGTILFTIGVMGLYLSRIYNETKNRPSYIIDNMIGF